MGFSYPPATGGGSSSGTVTSVGLALPVAVFTVSGSPVTSAGTLTAVFANQTQGTVFAGSASGGSITPTFRALVGTDLPFPTSSTLGGVESAAAVTHQWISAITTAGGITQSQPAFTDISGTAAAAQLPIATSTGTIGAVSVDGSTITVTSAGRIAAVGGGGGNVSNTGTPTSGQLAVWTNATTIQGLTALPAANFPALTGDITTSAGSLATTLATVATGATTGSSTAIPVITFNNKGLVTAVTTAAVIAPAGTLTGTTLASNVVTSSLTSVGTLGTGTWQATPVTAQYGGTGLATLTAHNLMVGAGTSNVAFIAPNTAGYVLTDNGVGNTPSFQAATAPVGIAGTTIQANNTSTTLQWTGLTSDRYLLIISNLTSSGANIGWQIGEGGTPTWETANYNVAAGYDGGGSHGSTHAESQSNARIELGIGMSSTANYGVTGIFVIGGLAAGAYPNLAGTISIMGSTLYTENQSSVYLGDTNAKTAFRLILTSNALAGYATLIPIS